MPNKYQFGVVVGRFQPYHNAHHALVSHALTLADTVIVVLGSARTSPDVKNPFIPIRRERMVRASFPDNMQSRLVFSSVRDYPYNENYWIAEVQNSVQSIIEDSPQAKDAETEYDVDKLSVALVGFMKDHTSYYLKNFPQWKFEQYFQNSAESKILSGTDIRELIFKDDLRWENYVTRPVVNQLREFISSNDYKTLKKEFDYIQQYKKDSKFTGLPYNAQFITTDAVVTCMGHVLVVRRGFQPGKGLIALPGGFLQGELTLEDNMLKELKEETSIHVDSSVLRGSIKDKHVFDYPYRSLRGRTVTHAFHIELQPTMRGLPLVRGGDDADKAFWLPVSEISSKEEQFFEDHRHIIGHFLSLV